VNRVTTDMGALFETESASWAERGEALLESGLTYSGERVVLVLARKREGRYLFSDQGAAIEAAGRPRGWREPAARVVDEYIVNITRHGIVWLPATQRQELAWISSLPERIAEASHAFYGELLELDAG
jgi:hypothetical protein